jgi:hypothetical protein
VGKYAKYEYKQIKPRRWKVHPIWRGIGVILIILVPILSYSGAYLVVRDNFKSRWFDVPVDLMKSVNFAPVLKYIPQLSGVVASIGRVYYIDLALTILFMVVGFGLLTILYGILYSTMGPSRYGPVDAEPIRKSPTTAARYK